jgi:hypothetical protein
MKHLLRGIPPERYTTRDQTGKPEEYIGKYEYYEKKSEKISQEKNDQCEESPGTDLLEKQNAENSFENERKFHEKGKEKCLMNIP